jgi:hypothetical protein
MKSRFSFSPALWIGGAALLVVLGTGAWLLRPAGHPSAASTPTLPPATAAEKSSVAATLPDSVRQILALPASKARDQKLATLLSDWLGRDPQRVRTFLDSLGMDDGDALSAQFFAVLPDALPHLDDRAARSPYLAEMVSRLIEETAADDPHRALKWAEAWLLDDSLDQARVTIAGELSRDNPQEAIALLGEIHNPLRRVEALSAIGEGFAENDPQGAIGWAGTLPHDTEIATAMNSVLVVMAEKDPAGAKEAFGAVQKRIADNYQRLLVQDRRRRGLPDAPELDAQGNELVRDAGGEDTPPSENPDFNLMADASETIAHALAAKDPAAALAWTNSLPGVLQTGSRRAALGAWAETDALQAYRYCQANGFRDAETYGAVFSAWSESDPHTAGREALAVTSPLARQQAITGVVSTWADASASEVTQWIDRMPDAADRDVANRSLAEEESGDRPQDAWRRAVLISNPDVRRSVLATAFASLVANAPAKAASALSEAPHLTSQERSELASMLESAVSR